MSVNDKDQLPIGDDSLDQLLREARWPDASPGTVARLTQRWQTAWTAQRRRDVLLRRTAAFAITATVLVAATLGWLQLRPRTKSITKQPVVEQSATKDSGSEKRRAPHQSTPTADRGTPVARNPQPATPGQHEPRQPVAAIAPNEVVAWRAPNQLEELMLAAHDRERAPASPSTANATSPPKRKSALGRPAQLAAGARPKSPAARKPLSIEQERVVTAVQRLLSDQRADIAAVALELRQSRARSERLLIETLADGKLRERVAAIRLLAEIGGPLSVAPLLRAAGQSTLHATALETLARLAEPAILGELAQSEQNAELQRSLLAALLARGESNSLDVYLSFVENESTAEAALSAARTLKGPPMDLLFASLAAPLESRRIAAARVIGRIDGAATTARLIGMIESGANRHEACIALLSSRGLEAARYVDSARRDPALAAIFSGARLFTPSEHPPRS